MELAQDVTDKAFHRIFADHQLLGNPSVRQANGNQFEHFDLALC
jgi:hypothetical protein